MSLQLPPVPNIDFIRGENPRLAEALEQFRLWMQNHATQTGSDPTQSQAQPPSQIQGVSVTASGGVFEIAISDTTPINQQINYFAEYSTSPAFNQPVVVDMGASRNLRLFLGNQNLYWRAYSQYRSSKPSPVAYLGTVQQPSVVKGGGSILGPQVQPSKGSGTANDNGTQGGSGFGIVPQR